MGTPTAGAPALGLFCSGLFTGVKEVGGGGFAKASILSDFTICGPPKLDLLTGGFDAGALAGVATGLGPGAASFIFKRSSGAANSLFALKESTEDAE